MQNENHQSTTNKLPINLMDADFFGQFWDDSWIYIKTIVDVVREPVLILDEKLCVIAANDPFYQTFQVDKSETVGKQIYGLGNGQWNIPALKELLEEILPRNSFFNGFDVTHNFPVIGRKVMLLNARKINYEPKDISKNYPPIILLAIEDITEMMTVADSLAGQVRQYQTSYNERTEKLENQVNLLTKALNGIKK